VSKKTISRRMYLTCPMCLRVIVRKSFPKGKDWTLMPQHMSSRSEQLCPGHKQPAKHVEMEVDYGRKEVPQAANIAADSEPLRVRDVCPVQPGVADVRPSTPVAPGTLEQRAADGLLAMPPQAALRVGG
jgi:hypothetical protein